MYRILLPRQVTLLIKVLWWYGPLCSSPSVQTFDLAFDGFALCICPLFDLIQEKPPPFDTSITGEALLGVVVWRFIPELDVVRIALCHLLFLRAGLGLKVRLLFFILLVGCDFL